MEITGTTVCTEELLKKFNKFHVLNNKKLITLYAVIEVLFLIAFVLIIVASDRLYFIVAIGFMVVALPLVLVFLPSVMLKSQRKIIGAENKFTFLDEDIKINSVAMGVKAEVEIKYQLIFKVYEKEDRFYIYQTNTYCYILRKADIDGGRVEELRNWLLAKLPSDKYVKNKSK